MKRLAYLGWPAFAVLLVAFIHTQAFRDELQQENERLRAKVSRMVEPPSLSHPLCPTGVMLAQRIDKRNRKGEIVKSRWVSKCVVAS